MLLFKKAYAEGGKINVQGSNGKTYAIQKKSKVGSMKSARIDGRTKLGRKVRSGALNRGNVVR